MAKQLSITRLRLTTFFVLDKFLGQLKMSCSEKRTLLLVFSSIFKCLNFLINIFLTAARNVISNQCSNTFLNVKNHVKKTSPKNLLYDITT